ERDHRRRTNERTMHDEGTHTITLYSLTGPAASIRVTRGITPTARVIERRIDDVTRSPSPARGRVSAIRTHSPPRAFLDVAFGCADGDWGRSPPCVVGGPYRADVFVGSTALEWIRTALA